MTIRPLVFLHIPKTSGISVSHALITAENPSTIFFGFDRAFFGAFTDFASIPEENRQFIHLTPDTIPRDAPMVRAHMSLSTLRAAYPGARFMTVLREPFCRLLSHYAFWRSFPQANDHAWGTWSARSALARGPLATFLSDPTIACQIDNVATRLLLWPHPQIPDNAMIDPRHDTALIEQARARLRTLDFADAMENPAFDTNLAAWLGTAPARIRMNETESIPPRLHTRLDQELTPAAQSLLTARSRLDLALWQTTIAQTETDPAALRATVLAQGAARAALKLAGA
jgi:hypothetical protein